MNKKHLMFICLAGIVLMCLLSAIFIIFSLWRSNDDGQKSSSVSTSDNSRNNSLTINGSAAESDTSSQNSLQEDSGMSESKNNYTISSVLPVFINEKVNVLTREFIPGNAEEKEFFISPNPLSTLHQHGDYFRVSDMASTFEYCFKGMIGQKAFISLLIAQEYKIEVSLDKISYLEIYNFNTYGRYKDKRSIDLTKYFEKNDKVYIRFSDANPKDGWGGHLFYLKYVSVETVNPSAIWLDISEGWTAQVDNVTSRYSAGTSIAVPANKEITFNKTIQIPLWWNENTIALSFSWIEAEEYTIYINDKIADISSKWGDNVTVRIPAQKNSNKIDIKVRVKSNSGKVGLWNSIRIGFEDFVTFPEMSWSFDSQTRKINKQYAPYDAVKLNSFAGNFMSTLYDSRYGLNNFDTSVKYKELYYPHDASRTLVALADEERYSPIVRLDYVRELYNGIVKAMVPGSDYEIFLKRDKRPKPVRASTENNKKLTWICEQDVVEPFIDMSVEFTEKSIVYSTGNLEITDKSTGFGLDRTYKSPETGSFTNVSIAWANGMADKPTTAKVVSSGGMSGYSIVFDNFNKRFYNKEFPIISNSSGEICLADSSTKIITAPKEGYFLLRTDLNWLPTGILFVWDIQPDAIKLVGSEDYFGYQRIELIYNDKTKTPTVTVLPFSDFDTNCKWPYAVANNIKQKNIYGANGFDPSYICGNEGLGTGALAAAAYLFKKYDDPQASDADKKAVRAMDAAIEALGRRNVPGIRYDRVAACDYLVKSGHIEYKEKARVWVDLTIADQKADGSFYWFDARNVLTLQRAYEVTNDKKYLDAVNKYRARVTYKPAMILYQEKILKDHIIFEGAGEIGYLGHMGDKEAVANVMEFSKTSIDDTGIFDCSDLNPYFLGWSLKGLMEKQYNESEKKKIIKKGQYVIYDKTGLYQVQSYPSAYINNPFIN